MEPKQFEILCSKLDLVLKILAIDKLSGRKQIEQVALLTDFGFRPTERDHINSRKTEKEKSLLILEAIKKLAYQL